MINNKPLYEMLVEYIKNNKKYNNIDYVQSIYYLQDIINLILKDFERGEINEN